MPEVLWYILGAVLALYGVLALAFLLLLPSKVAKPPWHLPRPGKTLQNKTIPNSWLGATNPEQLNLPFKNVIFLTPSGLSLRGWLMPAARRRYYKPSAAAVVCVHGAGRDRRAFLRHAVFLTDAGFDVLLFDCANHGASDSFPMWPLGPWPGRAVSLGKREHVDVISAVSFLKSRGAKRVAVLGTSQGASSAIIAAAMCDDIDALVLENPFSSPEVLVRHIVTSVLEKVPLPFFDTVMTPLLFRLSLFRTGNFPASEQKKAIDHMLRVTAPVLFIHGTADIVVNHNESEILYDAASMQHKQLWLVDNAPHTQCFNTKPEDFRIKVTEFLQTHLLHI
ncbi:unnamed protein product [Agarophyton chilense]